MNALSCREHLFLNLRMLTEASIHNAWQYILPKTEDDGTLQALGKYAFVIANLKESALQTMPWGICHLL